MEYKYGQIVRVMGQRTTIVGTRDNESLVEFPDGTRGWFYNNNTLMAESILIDREVLILELNKFFNRTDYEKTDGCEECQVQTIKFIRGFNG